MLLLTLLLGGLSNKFFLVIKFTADFCLGHLYFYHGSYLANGAGITFSLVLVTKWVKIFIFKYFKAVSFAVESRSKTHSLHETQ